MKSLQSLHCLPLFFCNQRALVPDSTVDSWIHSVPVLSFIRLNVIHAKCDRTYIGGNEIQALQRRINCMRLLNRKMRVRKADFHDTRREWIKYPFYYYHMSCTMDNEMKLTDRRAAAV